MQSKIYQKTTNICQCEKSVFKWGNMAILLLSDK